MEELLDFVIAALGSCVVVILLSRLAEGYRRKVAFWQLRMASQWEKKEARKLRDADFIANLDLFDNTVFWQEGPWYFKARRLRGRQPIARCQFIAWCARTPNLGSGPLDISAQFDTYVKFGETQGEAIEKLHREIGALS